MFGMGKWTFHSDLQPPLCLDDVTQMELEERLYDRLHINLDGFQVLFSDSGESSLLSRRLKLPNFIKLKSKKFSR